MPTATGPVALPDNAAPDLKLTAPLQTLLCQSHARRRKCFLKTSLAVGNEYRDGQVEFDSSDATTAANPYCFWLNNNHDGNFNMDGRYFAFRERLLKTGDDSTSAIISCTRDLEESIRDSGIPDSGMHSAAVHQYPAAAHQWRHCGETGVKRPPNPHFQVSGGGWRNSSLDGRQCGAGANLRLLQPAGWSR